MLQTFNVPDMVIVPPKFKIARLFESFVLFVNAEVPKMTGMICHKAQSAHGARSCRFSIKTGLAFGSERALL